MALAKIVRGKARQTRKVVAPVKTVPTSQDYFHFSVLTKEQVEKERNPAYNYVK
jgi:hypothetical protein